MTFIEEEGDIYATQREYETRLWVAKAVADHQTDRQYRQHRHVTRLMIASLVTVWVVMVHRIVKWVRS